mgnify:CR=1 FL=1
MANNKLYGYTPKNIKSSGKEGTIYSGAEEGNTYENIGNRLDRVNPFEFRKGMDYELTAIGCMRLAESTVEEREKATESVLKNLEENSGYYTSLITYETLFRNVQGAKPSFTTWLKEQDEYRMKEVNRGDEDSKHKNDKMSDKIKYTKGDYTVPFKTDPLKETIKKELRKILLEKKDDSMEEDDNIEVPQDVDDDSTDKAATKRAKKVKGDKFLEEREALETLLFKGKGGDEFNSKNPAPGTLKQMAKDSLGEYSKKYKELPDGLEQYNAYLAKLNSDKIFPKLEKIVEKLQKKYDKETNQTTITLEKVYAKDVDAKGYKGPGRLPDTIKLIEKRLEELKKEEESAIATLEGIRRNVAETDMTRLEHIKLLEICREHGVNLREGSMGVKMYYEIAKAAYLEGLANGLKI